MELNTERLRKVWALTSSPQAGEASAARHLAVKMVTAAGHTLADIPKLLNLRPGGESAFGSDEDWVNRMERDVAGFKKAWESYKAACEQTEAKTRRDKSKRSQKPAYETREAREQARQEEYRERAAREKARIDEERQRRGRAEAAKPAPGNATPEIPVREAASNVKTATKRAAKAKPAKKRASAAKPAPKRANKAPSPESATEKTATGQRARKAEPPASKRTSNAPPPARTASQSPVQQRAETVLPPEHPANPFEAAFAKMAADPEFQARQAAKRAALKAYRAALIDRYGSEAAVQAPTELERPIMAAAPWGFEAAFDALPRGGLDYEKLPADILEAIKSAAPLPRSIVEAKSEYDAWEERDRELAALDWQDAQGEHLSRACEVRRNILFDLVRTGLRATSMEDVIARQRFCLEHEYEAEGAPAILADLEHLASQQAAAQARQEASAAKPAAEAARAAAEPATGATAAPYRTATERRAEVRRLLSNVGTLTLPDREIARRVGVSPQTVGNLRRRGSV